MYPKEFRCQLEIWMYKWNAVPGSYVWNFFSSFLPVGTVHLSLVCLHDVKWLTPFLSVLFAPDEGPRAWRSMVRRRRVLSSSGCFSLSLVCLALSWCADITAVTVIMYVFLLYFHLAKSISPQTIFLSKNVHNQCTDVYCTWSHCIRKYVQNKLHKLIKTCWMEIFVSCVADAFLISTWYDQDHQIYLSLLKIRQTASMRCVWMLIK